MCFMNFQAADRGLNEQSKGKIKVLNETENKKVSEKLEKIKY